MLMVVNSHCIVFSRHSDVRVSLSCVRCLEIRIFQSAYETINVSVATPNLASQPLSLLYISNSL